MYINLPTPDQKCSKCGAINQTEWVKRDKGFGRMSVILRCTICGHEKVIAEESVYPHEEDNKQKGYTYNIQDRPEIEEF